MPISEKVKRAQEFAKARHGEQKHGNRAYYEHLKETSDVLLRFRFNSEDLHCAAFLHDTVEDTNTTINEISDMFGDKVASLVYAVTNPEGSREEQHAAVYERIRTTPDAIILKLADRIANTEYSLAVSSQVPPGVKPSKLVRFSRRCLDRYLREFEEFKEKTEDTRIETCSMWFHLESLLTTWHKDRIILKGFEFGNIYGITAEDFKSRVEKAFKEGK